MQFTNLRMAVEGPGELKAFMPNVPAKEFNQENRKGSLKVAALAYAVGDPETWVRGWQFTLIGEDGKLDDQRYLDAEEAKQVRALLGKWSDEQVHLGYEYLSKEGITFKKYPDSQGVSFLTFGFATKIGLRTASAVQQVFEFMDESAKLWEGASQ